VLAFTKMQAEQRDAREVNRDDSEVETVEAHVSCTSLARIVLRSVVRDGGVSRE
jgi:hypothetical protein